MTIVRVGATKKYSDGWENAFARRKKAQPAEPAAAAPRKGRAAATAPRKSAKKKTAAKKRGAK